FVAVHDAARPMIAPEKIELVFEACRTHGAAALAEPITDTVKRGELTSAGANPHLIVTGSVDRKQLYAMQTPQIFKRDLLDQAYAMAFEKGLSVTDEVSAVELLGHEVLIVPNQDFNF